MSRPTPLPKPTFLDRAIARLSPIQGVKRAQARMQLHGLEIMASSVERKAASRTGAMSGWNPRQLHRHAEQREREAITLRAQDLAANDAYASSAINSFATNTVGWGLNPQSQPTAQALNISEEEAQDVAAQAEWAWSIWRKQADANRRLTFNDIQLINIRTMLVTGEFLTLPLMKERPHRRYSLALRMVDPLRLRTPAGLASRSDIRDGVEIGPEGDPLAYYVANPTDGLITASLQVNQFKRYPAWVGHWPGVFHEFFATEPEQNRGVSVLAPGLKLFRDLDDYLDYELAAAIITAAFPVAIELASPTQGIMPTLGQTQGATNGQSRYYSEVSSGNFMYLNPGEKASVLEANRPSGTAEVFVRTVLRAVSAVTGQPYEVVAKDFSQTNYSSARAALLEVWRLYQTYRFWLVDHFCQRVWAMLFEEAWLRGDIILPAGAPDFYDAPEAWTNATWIGPARGHVDPVKEITAQVTALENLLTTHAQVAGEMGNDWDEILVRRTREEQAITDRGLAKREAASTSTGSQPEAPEEPPARRSN